MISWDIITVEDQWEIICGLSNDANANDLCVLNLQKYNMNREVHVACNCFIETEELLKAIGSHIYFNSGNIWKQCKTETLLLQITNRFRSPSSYMVSAEPFPGRSRPMSCKLAQMGPHQSPGCDYRASQLYKNISMLFLFPVPDVICCLQIYNRLI